MDLPLPLKDKGRDPDAVIVCHQPDTSASISRAALLLIVKENQGFFQNQSLLATQQPLIPPARPSGTGLKAPAPTSRSPVAELYVLPPLLSECA